MSQFGSQFHGRSDRKGLWERKGHEQEQGQEEERVGGYFTETKIGEEDEIKKRAGKGKEASRTS